MAELTVPSKKRRALADMLLAQQGPQAQMVGNRMVYNPNAGLLSGLAQGVGGFLKGREMKAEEDAEQARLQARAEELSKFLTAGEPAVPPSIQFSGGAPELSGLAASGFPSPVEGREARPASFDYRSAMASALMRGDTDSAQQYAGMGKLFQDQAGEFFAPDNYIDPRTGRVFGGQVGKDGSLRRLPFAVYKAPSSSYDPVSGALIQTGGLPLDMIEGYQSAPAAPGASAPQGGSSRVIPLVPEGKETPAARKMREDQERATRSEQREAERLEITRREAAAREKEAAAKQGDRAKKVQGAQVNFTTGLDMLKQLEQLVNSTPQGVLLNPRSREYARAKSLTTQLGDIYRSPEFADLGVINPADVPRIEAVVADPTSLSGALQGKDSQLERIKMMRQMLESRRRILFGDAPSEAPKPASKPAIGRLRIE